MFDNYNCLIQQFQLKTMLALNISQFTMNKWKNIAVILPLTKPYNNRRF